MLHLLYPLKKHTEDTPRPWHLSLSYIRRTCSQKMNLEDTLVNSLFHLPLPLSWKLMVLIFLLQAG